MSLSKLKKKCSKKVEKELLEKLDDMLVIHFDKDSKALRLEIKN